MANIVSKLVTVHECSCAKVGHTFTDDCWAAPGSIFLDIMWACRTIYPPLYLAAMLLRGKGISYLPHVLLDSLRSSVFLALNGFGFVSTFCVITKLCGGQHIFGSYIPGALGGFMAILAERKSRRSGLALYVFQVAVDFVFQQLKFRGYVSDLPQGEVYLFSIATAIMMFLYHHKETAKNGFMGSLLRFLLWEKKDTQEGEESHRPAVSLHQQALQCMTHYYRRLSASVFARLPRHPLSRPLMNSAEVGIRGFLLGYGIQTVIGLLTNLKAMFKKPGVLAKVIANKSSMLFGCFIGCFAGLFKALLTLLESFRGKDKGVNAALAGGLAGLSMFFYPSAGLATNLASKVLEMGYLELNHIGVLPCFYYFDCVLYALSFGMLAHASHLEPHNIRRSYYKFLLYVTAGKWADSDHYFFERMGTQAAYLKRNNLMPRVRV